MAKKEAETTGKKRNPEVEEEKSQDKKGMTESVEEEKEAKEEKAKEEKEEKTQEEKEE